MSENKTQQKVNYYPLKIVVVQEEGKVKMIAFTIKIKEGLKEKILYKPIWENGEYEDEAVLFKDLVDFIREKIEKTND